MKFKDLELYHVGRHNGSVFAGLTDGFNVVYGPNEAGKSTLMAGLRAMLFGRLTGTDPRLGAVRGASGRLRAESESRHEYTLERALARKSPVKVYGPNFEPQAGEEALFSAFPELQQLESSIYQSVFTFQLQELSDLSEHRSQLAQKLYTVGMIGEASPLQMEEQFKTSARGIYNPDRRARNPLLTQRLLRIQELKEEQGKQKDEVAAFLAVQEQVRDIEEKLREEQSTIEQLSEQRGYLHRVKQALPLYQTAQRSLAEQKLYGKPYEITEAMVMKAQRLEDDIDRLEKGTAEDEQSISRLSSNCKDIDVNLELLAKLPEVKKQVSKREKMMTLADLLDQARQNVTEYQLKYEELFSQLSGNWSLEEVARLQVDARTLSKAGEQLETMKRLETQRLQLDQQTHTWKEQVLRRSERLKIYGVDSAATAPAELQQQQQELQRKWSQLNDDEEQVETYAQLIGNKANIEQNILEMETQAALEVTRAGNQYGTAGAVSALGLVLVGLGIWQIGRAQVMVGVLTVLTAGAALAVSIWMWTRRSIPGNGRRSDAAVSHHLRQLQEEMHQVTGEMERILSRIRSFPLPRDIGAASLRRCVKQRQFELTQEAEKLRDLRAAADSLAEADETLQSLQRQMQFTAHQQEQLQQQSRQLQREAGWTAEQCVSISVWVDELGIIQEMMRIRFELARELHRMAEYEAELRTFISDVNLLRSDIDLQSTADRELAAAKLGDLSSVLWNSAIAAQYHSELRLVAAQLGEAAEDLQQILHEAEAAQEAQRKLQDIKQRLDETRTDLAAKQKNLKEKQAQIAEIYCSSGVETQAEFQQFLEEVKVYQDVKSSYRDAMLQLYGCCGGEAEYQVLENTLLHSTMEQIEEDLVLNEARLNEARVTYDNLSARLAEHKAQLRHWNSEQRQHLEWELSQVEAERDKLAFEWAGYKLAEALVKAARERYEEERQPEVLQTAGRLFKQVTNDRYKGLRSRFDEQGTARFVAVDARNQEWSFENLSRGTREQIYLCLRLGLVQDYSTRGIKMPLVLDDPLVNFDADRLDASLRLLADTATHCQIIYLTCHRNTLERISDILPASTVELSLAEGDG